MKNKIKFIMATLVAIFVCSTSVYAKTCYIECKGLSTKIDSKLPDTVHLIIVVLQIAVPVLLVIFGMLDLFKGITAQKEDEIKKGQQTFIKRLINAAIIFFVVAIVRLLVGLVTKDDGTDIMSCADKFLNGVDNEACVSTSVNE